MGGGRFQEQNYRGVSSEKRSGHFYYNAISKLRHVYFQVHVVYYKQHSAHSEHRDQRMCQVVTYKSLKTMENHSTFRPKKWSWSLTGGGKVLAFWIGGHFNTCMGGGLLWEEDVYGSSTVVRLISSCLEQTSLPIKDPLYGQRQIKLFHRKNMRYTKVSTCSYRSLLYLNKITSFSKEERN